MKSKFVNGRRTNAQRRAIYCMLRHLFGYTRTEARIVMSWRKRNIIRYVRQKLSKRCY